MRVAAVAALSFAATWLFFFEYLPGTKRVQFFSDIDGYHYPLYNHAHHALREGRLPEWDPAIYSGVDYLANPQAAFFYPPNWLLHWINRHRDGVRFFTIEALAILHFWIAFFTAWLWLRRRARSDVGALVGAAVFAFSGFMVGEVQHLGATCAYAWIPLGLHGVDRRSWRQVAVASALAFLSGYTSTWIVFCVCVAVYSLSERSWQRVRPAGGGLLVSLLLIAVQLGPSLEAAAAKVKEQVYGAGLPGGWFFFLNYALPNYYEQSNRAGKLGPETEQYLYLGAVALVALCFVRQVWPGALLLGASLFIALDPGGALVRLFGLFPFLGEAVREWNFLAGITAAFALLVAEGVAHVERHPWRAPSWMAPLSVGATVLWAARQLWVWEHGADFANGWATVGEVAISAAIGLALLRQKQTPIVIAALLLLIWTDYKVYGTSRRFNAVPGALDRDLANDKRTGGPEMVGLDNALYAKLLQNPHYRVVVADSEAGTEARHYRLSTPQGGDPFLPVTYKQAVERFVPFSTNRLFPFDWKNPEMMDAFGVRYVLSNRVLNHPGFRLAPESTDSYHKFYEYLAARPVYRFEAGSTEPTHWTPEHRVFTVESATGGTFTLLENYATGWRATVDGVAVPIERSRITFQSIPVPGGKHQVEFRYRNRALLPGAVLTMLGLLLLIPLPRAWRGLPGRTRSTGPPPATASAGSVPGAPETTH